MQPASQQSTPKTEPEPELRISTAPLADAELRELLSKREREPAAERVTQRRAAASAETLSSRERDVCEYRCAMRLLALLAIVLAPTAAFAEGEYGPMLGGALVATRAPDTELAGAQLELAMWRGHLGVAVESSYQRGLDTRVTTLGASARLLLFRDMTPSLLEPHEDVELGLEAHAIAERAWWNDDHVAREPISYGGGLVLRLRGGTDFSNILAESRLFVRALWSRHEPMDTIARGVMPPAEHGVLIVVGLGAVFGGGEPGYAKQFRPKPLDASILPVN